MKRTYLISLISLLIIGILGIVFFSFQSTDSDIPEQTIAEQQEVTAADTPLETEETEYLTPEKQKQLNQITSAYSQQKLAYRAEVEKTMQKYNSSFSQSDTDQMLSLIDSSKNEDDLAAYIKAQFNVTFLKADINKMLASNSDIIEEKELELARLESFRQKNNTEIDDNTQTLFQLTINESLRQNSTISSGDISTISQEVSQNLFQRDSYILERESYQSQISLIQDELSSSLSEITSLSQVEKLKLIKIVSDDISNLGMLIESQEIEDESTSFTPVLNGLKYLSSLFYYEASADESPDLSVAEREILILKTEILIDRILQESIETEIEYNAGNISQISYENIIEDNLIELEELVILKDSLENDPDAISLWDIQRFNLWAYVDDSEAIEDLPVLAYIQSKTGHIVVHNLNGSAKLGEENMSLYSWYSIKTLDQWEVTIIFSDESVLKLEPLSKVTITSPSEWNISVGVERWAVWSRVLKPLLSGDRVTIHVDDVSLWVRGTSLYVSKQESGSNIQIVDSYTSDWSASVEMTDQWGSTSSIMPGQEISIDSSGNTSVSDKSRANLLGENPNIWEFISDDLEYLSLLIDDRKRGFYNTPFVTKNDGENFINKLVWELEVSIPQWSETPYIIKNSELNWELVNTGSIYHLIKKDAIISALKDNPSWASSAKIAAVRNLDMVDLEQELWNLRAIENLFHYNIVQDITDKSTFTTWELKEIFTGFPLEDVQDEAKLLAEVKQNLTVNGGSNVVTGDITLDTEIWGVDITWKSSLTDIISDTGIAPPRADEASTILTATLTIWNLSASKDFWVTVAPREATPEEELDAALLILSEYIWTMQNQFINEIIIQNDPFISDTPDFIADRGIIPLIKFTWSDLVLEDGTTNRPAFLDSPLSEYQSTIITATLTHPQFADVTVTNTYEVDIKRKDITDTELLVQAEQAGDGLLDVAESLLRAHYIDEIQEIRDSLTHGNLPVWVILEWEDWDDYIDSLWNVTRPKYGEWDELITVKAKLTHLDVRIPRYVSNIELNIVEEACDGTPIGWECYELVAQAEYNVAGDYNLKYDGSTLVSADVWDGVTKNSLDLNIESRNIEELDEYKSLVRVWGQKWIYLDNNGGDDFLSYNLSQLPEPLWDDWAIEMSVRGEDLKRSDTYENGDIRNYWLISISWEVYIHNEKWTLWLNDNRESQPYRREKQPQPYKEEFTDWYTKIRLTKNKLFIENKYEHRYDSLDIIDEIELSAAENIIKVWSNRNSNQQWNWVINHLKIYNIKF